MRFFYSPLVGRYTNKVDLHVANMSMIQLLEFCMVYDDEQKTAVAACVITIIGSEEGKSIKVERFHQANSADEAHSYARNFLVRTVDQELNNMQEAYPTKSVETKMYPFDPSDCKFTWLASEEELSQHLSNNHGTDALVRIREKLLNVKAYESWGSW